MKANRFLLLFLGLCIISCQNNDDFTASETKTISTENARGSTPPTDAEYIENHLQWVSFLVARTLILNQDVSIETQFLNAIFMDSNNQQIIRLHDLLGSGGANASDFYNAFEVQFWNHHNVGCGLIEFCPGGDDGPMSGNPPGNVGGDCTDQFCFYLEVLLEDNCFEIYLPNGYNRLTSAIMTSAHPMSYEISNNGYKHLIDTTNNIPSINEFNVPQLHNLLVARPYRIINSNNCSYGDYNFDFTQFLD